MFRSLAGSAIESLYGTCEHLVVQREGLNTWCTGMAPVCIHPCYTWGQVLHGNGLTQLVDGMPSGDQLWALGTGTDTFYSRGLEGSPGIPAQAAVFPQGVPTAQGGLMTSLQRLSKGGRCSAWLGFRIDLS